MKFTPDYTSKFRILKGGRVSLVVSAFFASTTLSFAAPSGGTVTSGSAAIHQSGGTTNIDQSTQKVSINWQKFGIAQGETVNFKQPDVNSIALNRVVGNEKSVIDGALNANGQVWILNGNGVLFGKNARVNTAGLLATTKNLSDEDFIAGSYSFTGDSEASVINMGTIDISDSGYAVLLAKSVSNEGEIRAMRGTVHLTGAEEATINLNGNSLIDLTVDKGVLDALVENKGAIYADGGSIYLTTNAVDDLLKGVVNNEGIIEANSLDGVTGQVELYAHGGEVQVGGTITALDGFVETSGKDFVFNDATVQAGEWLIDPVNVTIDDSLATAIESQLTNGDATIQTNGNSTPSTTSGESGTEGNIYVNSGITWDTAQKLTLDAYNDIYINEAITATNANGQLALYYGQGAEASGNTADYYVKAPISLKAGDNFFTKLGNDVAETPWTVITSLGSAGSTTGTDLQGINGDLTGNYVLGDDIDASGTASWNPTVSGNEGWTPIGSNANKFTGNFDGLGHTVDGLYINRDDSHQGLFGYTDDYGTIRNIGVTNVNIQGGGGWYIAGLVGANFNSVLSNSYATGSVSGGKYVGGLTGYSNAKISNSYAIGSVSGSDDYVGGLVAYAGGTISNSYASGTVIGNGDNVGGVGWKQSYTFQLLL